MIISMGVKIMNLVKDNLAIRNALASDAEQLCAWWNDGKIMAHAGFPGGINTTPDEIRNSLKGDSDESHRRHIIELDGRPIGEMNYRSKGNKTAEIGIKICDFDVQEKGFGTILLVIFIDSLFMYYGYEKVILDTSSENKRAQHVYEKKLGFKTVGRNSWVDGMGNSQTSIDYDLAKDDWLIRADKPPSYIHMRLERPCDHYNVEYLTREAFSKTFDEEKQEFCDEHLLVHRLRKSASFVPELNYIAEINGNIAGHIIYSKSRIIDDKDNAHKVLTFGPLSVLPEYQNQGIGKALMRHSFKAARDMGYRAIVIYGHPGYYPKVGFRRSAEFGIETPDGKTFDAFMVLPLYEAALDGIQGRHHLDSAYNTLSKEDAMHYDKQFPPKSYYPPV